VSATTSKVTRSQQVVLIAPPSVAAMSALVRPALERVSDESTVQLLVLVPDADTAVTLAQAMVPSDGGVTPLLPITSGPRGARALGGAPRAVVGAPADIADTLISGQLKLGAVAQFIMLQAELTLSLVEGDIMTALMAEVPTDAARTVAMSGESEAVSAFIKAHMKRPRRVSEETLAGGPMSLQYVLVSDVTRAATLRRVLDAVNAPSTIVAAPDAESLRDATAALRALGYGADDADVRAMTGPITTHSVLRVLYDVPATHASLDESLGGSPVQAVALVTPRQVAHLRSLLSGGSLTLFALPDVMAKAVGRDGARLLELRKVLTDGVSARELAALEPLLEQHDALEIAAAALRLLERERETAKGLRIGVTTAQPKEVKRAMAVAAAPVEVVMPAMREPVADEATPIVPIESLAPEMPELESVPEWQSVWINVGAQDGATASTFVGTITGETGLDRSVIGAIDIRDSHSLVEIAGDKAAQVVAALTGATIRGRDAIARIDRLGAPRTSSRGGDRAPRSGGGARGGFKREGGFSRDGGDRPARGGFKREGGFSRDGGDRPARSGFKREGGFSRDGGDRPSRGGFSRDSGDRPSRGGFSRDGGDRPARGGFSRDGGDRQARPSFQREGGFSRDGGERPARGGFSRDGGDRPARPSFKREGGFSRDGGDRPARPGFKREGGFSRDGGDRPARGGFKREGGFSRDGGDRPARGGFKRDGGPSRDSGFGRGGDAPERGPRDFGRNRDDFAERAERLRNSRKPRRDDA
jgi:ATP-dependent RNA helicase DeaD